MNFHRTDADIEIVGNTLVRSTGDQRIEHLPLAWTESSDPLRCLDSFAIAVRAPRNRQSKLDCLDKNLVVVGLFNEVNRAGLHGPHRRLHITLARYDDHG